MTTDRYRRVRSLHHHCVRHVDRVRLLGVLLASAGILAGCSGVKKASAAQPRVIKQGDVPPRQSVVDIPAQPYRAVGVSAGGRITGTIDFDGPIPRDSVIQLAADQMGCGQSITDARVEHSGPRIGGAVVWLTDIRAGKPLAVERRFELSNKDCILTPRIQAVITSGTLNVASEDAALHRNRIINVATGETEGIAPFNDNGEVVPFDRLLSKPAQLEVVCDFHAWQRAWILVFDHPYFALSARSGDFSIADIPAGTYRVKAWHPVLGIAEQTVTIAAGQDAKLALKLVQPAATPIPVPAPVTAPAPTG